MSPALNAHGVQRIEHELVRWWGRFSEAFWDCELSPARISIEPLIPHSRVAAYRRGDHASEVVHRVKISSLHLGRGPAFTLAALLHESIHAIQATRSGRSFLNYHGGKFRDMAIALGIPCDWRGRFFFLMDGPLARLLRAHQVPFMLGRECQCEAGGLA